MYKNKKATWEILLVAAMATWGLHYPLLKLISHEVDPILLTLIRFSCASILLTPLIKKTHSQKKPDPQDFKAIITIGVLIAFAATLIFIGIKHSSAINGAILSNSSPLLITLLTPILLHKRISKTKLIAVHIGLIAMAITILNGNSIGPFFESNYFFGTGLLIIATLIISLVTIWETHLIKKYGGLYFTYLTMLAGVAVFFIISTIQGSIFTLPTLSTQTLLVTLLLGGLTTALPYTIWNASLKYIDIKAASSFKFLTPGFTALYSILFFDANITLWIASGILFISLAVYLMQKDDAPTPSPQKLNCTKAEKVV